MHFTYSSYINLVRLLRENNYEIADYHNWRQNEKCAILRHDIDYNLDKAVSMAQLECKIGISSTYFVLLTSDFYNVFSKNSTEKLAEIIHSGHKLGLHFDEMRYAECTDEEMRQNILNETKTLQDWIGTEITVVSMHRPSRQTINSDLKIPGMINSYGHTFFHDFKYISDSRRCWREPVRKVIENDGADYLHILTHPFWYSEEQYDLHDTVAQFINSANRDRYIQLNENISDLEQIMDIGEIR